MYIDLSLLLDLWSFRIVLHAIISWADNFLFILNLCSALPPEEYDDHNDNHNDNDNHNNVDVDLDGDDGADYYDYDVVEENLDRVLPV